MITQIPSFEKCANVNEDIVECEEKTGSSLKNNLRNEGSNNKNDGQDPYYADIATPIPKSPDIAFDFLEFYTLLKLQITSKKNEFIILDQRIQEQYQGSAGMYYGQIPNQKVMNRDYGYSKNDKRRRGSSEESSKHSIENRKRHREYSSSEDRNNRRSYSNERRKPYRSPRRYD